MHFFITNLIVSNSKFEKLISNMGFKNITCYKFHL